MRKKLYLLFVSTFLLFSCGKKQVDGSSPKKFRSSINEMASQLNNIQQIKFNEALYILKTFGSDKENYFDQMADLRKKLAGKKTQEIFNMADLLAQQEGIDWSSTNPPSMGSLNIFNEVVAKEADPNEIDADELSITIKPASIDANIGAKALKIMPQLMKKGNLVQFEKSALPVVLEVFSGGKRLLKRRNLMKGNAFKGFYMSFNQLPYAKIEDGKIDILVSIKTSNNAFKATKTGISVNEKVFSEKPDKKIEYQPFTNEKDSLSTAQKEKTKIAETEKPKAKNTEKQEKDKQEPKTSAASTVRTFLGHLRAKKLKKAYKVSKNPNWGTYDQFSNPNSGFGSVKKLSIKNIKTNTENSKTASVNASYDVEDTHGNKSALNVKFELQNINGTWKITRYTIQ